LSQKFSPGSYVVGLKQSIKMIQSRRAKKVYLASDADFHILRQVSDICLSNEVCNDTSFTKSELGKMCKIEVGASVVTLLN